MSSRKKPSPYNDSQSSSMKKVNKNRISVSDDLKSFYMSYFDRDSLDESMLPSITGK